MTGDMYSLECKWIPKATKQENLDDLDRVPKEVQLPPTSMSTKQGIFAPQPSDLRSSEKLVWKPKEIKKEKEPIAIG